MLTRPEFEQRRAEAARFDRRQGRLLAAVAVGLGLAQLALLRWAEGRFEPAAVKLLGGSVFIAYAALVGGLLWRWRRRAQPLRCPACGQQLTGLSERIAAATGRCDSCGEQIIA